jgi:hypothetical protein
MGAILSQTSETDVANGAAVRPMFRSDAETAMREVVEQWLRDRLSGARLIHEINMCQGGARIDLVAAGEAHLIGVEIKGPWDSADRVIGQIAAFRMVMPELWLVVAGRMKSATVEIVQYLFPTVGVAEVVHRDGADAENWSEREYRAMWGAPGVPVDRSKLLLVVLREPVRVEPLSRALLNMLWVAELQSEAVRAKVWQGKPGTHGKLIDAMTPLSPEEKLAAACRQLRCRPTQHRADDAIGAA